MSEENNLKLIQETLEKDRAKLLDDIRREKARLDAYSLDENLSTFDLADRTRYQEISLNRLDYMEKWLEQIESTLKRVSEGNYGICARCCKPIHPGRLKAMPSAAYCLECQKKLERRPY